MQRLGEIAARIAGRLKAGRESLQKKGPAGVELGETKEVGGRRAVVVEGRRPPASDQPRGGSGDRGIGITDATGRRPCPGRLVPPARRTAPHAGGTTFRPTADIQQAGAG